MVGLFSIVFSIGLSFFRLSSGSLLSSAIFAGIDNFRDFLFGRDQLLTRNFWRALGHNIWISGSMICFVIPLSLSLAMLLQRIGRGVAIFRTVFLIPMVTASVSIYYVWTGIYNARGSLNQFLANIPFLDNLIQANGWLGELNTALPSMIVMIIWSAIPGTLILYFAGLQTIDKNLYEAADIDGGSDFQKLLHITWPMLTPITVIAVVINLNAALQIFEQIWVMTKGGPAGSTMVLNVLIYQEAFVTGAGLGRANAMGWSVFLLTFIMSLISMRLLRDPADR